MPIETAIVEPDAPSADVIAAAVAEPAAELPAAVARLDQRLGGRLRGIVADGEFAGELGEACLVHLDDGRRLAVGGLGERERIDGDAVRTAAAAVAELTRNLGGTLAWIVDDELPLAADEQARALVEGTVLGAYDPGRWKSSDGRRRELTRIELATAVKAVGDVAERAATVSEWVNRARDLANAPPNELTPEGLAARAAELARGIDSLRAEALGRSEIVELGMGAFAAVAQGSVNEPRLIVLRYEPEGARGDVTLGLVGKGITFDTGGISIKPALKMEEMKGDMAGGGGVIAGMCAVAALQVPVRAIAIVAATENMADGGAYRPGDILRAANGKTIEVTNTDAEGRLVLADALWYARREGATHVLDLATLTGAMELALGDLYAGVFVNDDDWGEAILAAAHRSGDHLWPFPLHPRYRRYVDSAYADMKNSSDLRQASPALAAEFLQEFAGEGPWAHVDMAGPGFLERSRGDYLTQPGGTGFGVRLIVELALGLAA
jgi:leucyl aminopeptidase